jgi:multiple antibiotic resistance protein
MYSILYDAYHNFVYTFISLFSILNPIGMSAVFLAMTKNYPAKQRRNMAWRVAIYGTVLLVVVFFIGSYILNFFGISLAALQVAGGLLVFATAWQMLNAPDTPAEHDAINSGNNRYNTDITFFPLTMPITAGAGAMAVTVALAANLSQDGHENYIISHLSATRGILAVFSVVGICYAFADRIFLKLGTTGTNVVTRLTAFILLAISVGIVWSGIKTLILSIH